MVTKQKNNNIKKRKVWTHIPYEKDDLPAIGLFFKEFYIGQGDYGTMGFFDWKIVRNYSQQGIINLIKDGKKIVSTATVTPKLLMHNHEVVNVAEIGDVYTHPDYQRQGMFSLLGNETRKEAEKKDMNFIYGLPNEMALPGWLKNNFNIIQNLEMKALVFPINIRTRISKRSHWIIGSLIGSVFSVLSFLYHRVKNLYLFSDKSIVVQEISQCPEDWNNFWNGAKEAYDFIINRDHAATTWRYLDNPNKYKLISLRKNDKLTGYLVYRIVYGEEATNIIIADFLTLPGAENAIYVGLNHIINTAYNIDADNVSLWCVEKSPYFEVFKSKGFFKRGNVPIIYYQNDFAEKIINCNLWHFTIGDSDNI